MWSIARAQHELITRAQLLELGYTVDAIKHRVGRGRLHVVHRGVYAVGRPRLTRKGEWMAAVLACGSRACLSHSDGASLLGIRKDYGGDIEVSVVQGAPEPSGIVVHRRKHFEATPVDGIAVTTAACTIVDLAPRVTRSDLERMIGEADKLRLIDPERLRGEVEAMPRRPGVKIVRKLLDQHSYVLTHTELERLFLPLALRAGLPRPLGQEHLNGYRVDFFFPELGLVVETDGLTYHRTAAQQATDRLRDQAHTRAGLTVLRFTHAQIRFAPEEVVATLAAVAKRLSARGSGARRTAA